MCTGAGADRIRLTRRQLAVGAAAIALSGCSGGSGRSGAAPPASPESSPAPSPTSTGSPTPAPSPSSPPPATAEQIAARATVPVLCYHQLRDWRSGDSAYSRQVLICPPAAFRAQLDALAADGWTTIGPDQYLAHLETGAPLPAKPVLLSFDDAQGTQATEALPQLVARGMTGTFFAMTVVLGNPGWLSKDDLRRIAGAGMTVAAHTYDHHRADRYTAPDWSLQLEQPRALLEQVVGAPVEHFAYPYGAWDDEAVAHLEAAGYRTAFQLSDKPLSPTAPLYTLRRFLVDSTWTGPQLLAALAS